MYQVTQKTKENIELKINDRDYLFICGPDSPLSDALQAIKVVEQYLIEKLKAVSPLEQPQEPIVEAE